MVRLRKDDLKAHGYTSGGSDKNRKTAIICAIEWYKDPIPVLRLLYTLISRTKSESISNKLDKDIRFIHRHWKIPFPLDIKNPYSTEYTFRKGGYGGGDINEQVSSLSTKGLGVLQNQLYKIPEVGKVLKFVGDNAESAVMKALSLFGYTGAITSPAVLAKEKGIDVFEWDRDFTPDELAYFGYSWITPLDQQQFRAYSTAFPQTGGYISNYQQKLTNWLQQNGILPPNGTIDQALSDPNSKYVRFQSVISALSNIHGELANVNTILYEKGLFKKGDQTPITSVPTGGKLILQKRIKKLLKND